MMEEKICVTGGEEGEAILEEEEDSEEHPQEDEEDIQPHFRGYHRGCCGGKGRRVYMRYPPHGVWGMPPPCLYGERGCYYMKDRCYGLQRESCPCYGYEYQFNYPCRFGRREQRFCSQPPCLYGPSPYWRWGMPPPPPPPYSYGPRCECPPDCPCRFGGRCICHKRMGMNYFQPPMCGMLPPPPPCYCHDFCPYPWGPMCPPPCGE